MCFIIFTEVYFCLRLTLRLSRQVLLSNTADCWGAWFHFIQGPSPQCRLAAMVPTPSISCHVCTLTFCSSPISWYLLSCFITHFLISSHVFQCLSLVVCGHYDRHFVHVLIPSHLFHSVSPALLHSSFLSTMANISVLNVAKIFYLSMFYLCYQLSFHS